MRLLYRVVIILFFSTSFAMAESASKWLEKEINIILDAYKNTSISNEDRFNLIENTINSNFAGAGIAKFVSGDSWLSASKETKKEYVRLFKRHLALNIASLMKGYSDQKFKLTNSRYDSKNKVSMINMKILGDTGDLLVTWRVKKSKDLYFVIDLMVADISLVVTKRSEFNSMLKKVDNNLDIFNDILREQNELSYTKLIN